MNDLPISEDFWAPEAARRRLDELNRRLYPNGRDAAWARLSAMAGLDSEGSIAPPVTWDSDPGDEIAGE